MTTPKYALVLRAAAAAAVMLAGSSVAVPALAETGPAGTATATASPSPSAAPTSSLPPARPSPSPSQAAGAAGISDAGLADAVRRDLGLTLDEFNAAGQLAKRAADAEPSLRGLPGYVGISLTGGQIAVQGSGAELQARVDELNATGPGFVLVAPAPVVPPAAPSGADRVASSTDQLFEAYIREVGPAGLQAVAYTGEHYVIRTGGTTTAEAALPAVLDPHSPAASVDQTPGRISAAQFVARYKNVQLEKGVSLKTEGDFFGGQGYAMPYGAACSAGFGAYAGDGRPVLLTAGHCASDGAVTEVSIEDPASSPAAGAPQARPAVGIGALGTFGFSQFGGPGNSWITGTESSPGNIGTDIAVIRDLAPGVSVQPAVTKWRGDAPAYTSADPANPGPTAVKIIGALAPKVDQQPVCRSGRTTGWKCGHVDEIDGIYVVGGATSSAADLRAFRGFHSTDVKSGGGDSGGPWITGNYAVGTHSAAESEAGKQVGAIAATLVDSMAQIPDGVQLQLFLNKPELVAPENLTFKTGGLITGRVPAAPATAVAGGSKVRITIDGGQPTEVPVDNAGNWSLPAPPTPRRLSLTAETVNGFSSSGSVSLAVSISDLDSPVIAAADAGPALKTLSQVDGTGTPRLTVRLTGDVTGSEPVHPDGRWSVPVTRPVYGRLVVHAVQTSPGALDSPSVSSTFTVAPPAPTESSIQNGLQLRQDSLPGTISGTGVDGADVTVSIDGTPLGSAAAGAGGSGIGARAVVRSLVPQVLVAGGRWSVPFPARLVPGAHTLSVTQSVDGVASEPLTVSFSIQAAVAAAAAAAQPAAATAAAALPAGPPPAGDEPGDVAEAPEAPAAPSGQADAVPEATAKQPAAAPTRAAAAPAGAPPRSGQAPGTGIEWLLPAAGLAGGSVLLAGALLIAGRRRAVRAAPSAQD